MLALVGDQFAGIGGAEGGTELPDICGATISVRQNEDIVSVWNRVEGDQKLRERIRSVPLLDANECLRSDRVSLSDTIRRVLNLPPTVIMEYKSNNGGSNIATSVICTR